MKAELKWAATIIVLATLLQVGQVFGQNPPLIFQGWSDGAWLGVSISDLSKSKANELKLPDENGVLIDRVEKDSPSEKSGLQVDDVIVQCNGSRVFTVRQFARLIGELLPDRTISLAVIRNGSTRTFTVTLGQRPKGEGGIRIWPDGGDFHATDIEPLRKNLEPLLEKYRYWDGSRGPLTLSLLEPFHRRLGVSLDTLTPQLGEYFGVKEGHGALVVSVEKDSPAEKAEIKAGDVIVGIDSKEVTSPSDVVRFIREKSEGDIALKILRDRQVKILTAHLKKKEIEFQKYHPLVRTRHAARAFGEAVI